MMSVIDSTYDPRVDPLAKEVRERWNKSGELFIRQLIPGSDRYAQMEFLLSTYFGGGELLKLGSVKNSWAVMNMRLVSAFCSRRVLLLERIKMFPREFNHENWRKENDSNAKMRRYVYDKYKELISLFPWNNANGTGTSVSDVVPLLPVVHGTTANVAWSIARTGFTSLSSLDDGYFGSGMYFTTNAMYALPYYANKERPTLILCLMTPGAVYPVCENPKDAKNLMGQPIKISYQSHFVSTFHNGRAVSADFELAQKGGTVLFNELVCDQENMILPLFLVEFDKPILAAAAKKFTREIQVNPKELHLDDDLKDEDVENDTMAPVSVGRLQFAWRPDQMGGEMGQTLSKGL